MSLLLILMEGIHEFESMVASPDISARPSPWCPSGITRETAWYRLKAVCFYPVDLMGFKSLSVLGTFVGVP